MANDEENHALIADEETPTEFALMAKTSAESEVFDNSLCSKACKKNFDSLNSKITELTDKLYDAKNMIYHYKLALAQVEARPAEHRKQKLKYCEKIRVLEFKTESSTDCIKSLKKELELIKKEKEGLDSKLAGFQTASKDLDSLLESQRLNKNKEGLGYNVVHPPPAQVYSPPKKDFSWTGLPEFKDDTVTDYSRPSPAIENKVEIAKKPHVKYAEQYRKPTKKPNGSSQNNIDDKGYWDSGYSRHMTGNISCLSDYEPFDRGYVSFGQGGCKITGKETIKTGKLEFENVYFVKDLNNKIMARLKFCDYHNMVAILEKSEHNVDFHLIVDFVEASPLRYALTFKPTVYVSHIRQFWSTARIETTKQGTKILATIYGILRTVTESSLKRNLKLKDEEGISSLPDANLFEKLTLMGYNISPNQKFTFQKGQFSHQWKYLIHTFMQCLSPKSTGFNEFSSNIATALVCLATNRVYNFSKMIFDGMGEGSCTPTEPHHTPSSEAQQTSFTTHSSPTLSPVTTAPIPTVTSYDTPPLKQYTRRTRIAQSSVLPHVAVEPVSHIGDGSQGEACPTDSGFVADQDRAKIAKTSTLPHDSAPRVTSPAADEGSMQQKLDELTALCTSLQRQHSEMVAKFEAQELKINSLKARIQVLKDKDRKVAEQSGDDAPIKGRRLDVEEEAAERVSDDTEEMATVLTSMDAATVLSGGVVEVSTGSGFIPTAGPPAADVPTGSDVVLTAGPIFATATVVTPYTRRKGKENMIEFETPKKKKIQEQMDIQMARQLEEEMERETQRMNEQIARDAEIAKIHAEEELQIMIDELDRSNETVAKYLQEYHQFATELPIERRIELISDLVNYQDNYAKVHKYQSQQRKPLTKKQQREFYTSVIRNQAGWKAKDFKGMALEEIKENFDLVWKQIHDFILIGSKEEAERFKRKGIRFEQESVKKLKTSEEVKATEEVPKDKNVHTEGQRNYWKIIRLGGRSASYQFFVDLLKHLDMEDLNQLWALVKESLNIRPASSDKKMELWVELKRLYEPDVEDQLWTHTQNMMHTPVEWKLYDSCGVHHVTSKDNEIFMLIEKDYPLRKGLATVMISYKLQVENYSQMENDLILKIYKIANCSIMEFPLAEDVPTASEESSHCQKKRDATAEKIALLLKSSSNCQSSHMTVTPS
nr:hypothetical protein [Tanacetum cinerariifolium]